MRADMTKRGMPASRLEEELEALMVEFVARIVATLKSASFGEVASLAPSEGALRGVSIPRAKRAAPALTLPSDRARGGRRPRQDADKRAELGERVMATLSKAASPLGVRALSSELGVAPDLLTAPLKELREAGRIAKHGDKRSTTYSAAQAR